MKRVTKHLVAFGLTMAMFVPMAAVAVSAADVASSGGGVLLAQTSGANPTKPSTSIGKSFKDVGDAAGLSTTRELPSIIGSIINAAMGILGIILVVIIIYAGYKWMMAQGNSQQVDEAKKMITNAVIGLVILMASYAIAQFVLNAVIKGTTGEELKTS